MREELINKVKFVKELNEAVSKNQANVESIEYRVYTHVNGCIQEYLVINYKGGARTVRNCNGNSTSAIFGEIARYLDSGYYNEVGNLEKLEANPDWTLEII